MNIPISKVCYSTHGHRAPVVAFQNAVECLLFPIPLYANELLPVGAITITHIAEKGYFFAKKTNDGYEEIDYENQQLAEVWLTTLHEAIKQGWVNIKAAPPRRVPVFT